MLGWNAAMEEAFAPLRTQGYAPGRVAVEDKHHYVVFTGTSALVGKVSGKLLHRSPSAADLPKVGDWAAVSKVPVEEKLVIHEVLPRRTKLSRKVPGRETEEQVLVALHDLCDKLGAKALGAAAMFMYDFAVDCQQAPPPDFPRAI
jgi:ribosome biogenesis GTPase